MIGRDLIRGTEREYAHLDHLRAAIDWLCRAQDVRDDKPDSGGVSAGWSFEDGWLPSYPETSGYIVETFIAAAEVLDRPELVDRAQRIIDWELSIQRPDGAFPGHFGEPGSQPVVFNTGQIMHGMLAGYLQLRRPECLEAAVKAGHWLARVQDADGCWRQFEHNGVPHTYNTRASWALLATALIAGDAPLEDGRDPQSRLGAGATARIRLVRQQCVHSGPGAVHAHDRVRHPRVSRVRRAARQQPLRRRCAQGCARAGQCAARAMAGLPGPMTPTGLRARRYCCLTGVAQMSVNWMRCAQAAGAVELRDNARTAIAFLKRRQRLDDRDRSHAAAIAGSAPIWGAYSRFEFPNWAAKFFADALMMDHNDRPVPPVLELVSVAAGDRGACLACR